MQLSIRLHLPIGCDRINLDTTKAFGKEFFTFNTNLKNRKWVRVEVWDVAANGAFTQSIWINK
jgi:hypothetical protein